LIMALCSRAEVEGWLRNGGALTLVAAWIRAVGPLRELVMVTDSRLSAGPERSDGNPKLISLGRPATAVAMSGSAPEAYSFLLQVMNTSALLDGHASGRTDIGGFASGLRDVLQDSHQQGFDDFTNGRPDKVPILEVLLAGWSWRNSRFEGYSFSFLPDGKVQLKPLKELDLTTANGVYLAGDGASSARKAIKKRMSVNNVLRPMRGDPDASVKALRYFLDWEPLEVLLEMTEDRKQRTVGGVPQVLRIYQYGQTETFVWRDEEGADHYGGRRMLHNERFDRRIMRYHEGQVQIRYSDRSAPVTNQDWQSAKRPATGQGAEPLP
jgi:hypothetical protein